MNNSTLFDSGNATEPTVTDLHDSQARGFRPKTRKFIRKSRYRRLIIRLNSTPLPSLVNIIPILRQRVQISSLF